MIANSNQKGYWFWVLKPCSETELSWVKVLENLRFCRNLINEKTFSSTNE